MICIKSLYGLYFNKAKTTPAMYQINKLIDSTRFKDHSENTVFARSYMNPSKVLDNIMKFYIFLKICPASPPCVGCGIGFKYEKGQAGSFKPLGVAATSDTTFQYFAGDKSPIIQTATWIDIAVSLDYKGSSSSTGTLNLKAYSTKEEFYSESITINNGILPDISLANDINFNNIIYSYKNMDFTMQYVSVYGGVKTYEYIQESYGKTPPEGLSIPPEYCSDASDAFLLQGCTSQIGERCKATADCSCHGSDGSHGSTKAEYKNGLETRDIVGIAIGVSFGVDIILVAIFFFFIFI